MLLFYCSNCENIALLNRVQVKYGDTWAPHRGRQGNEWDNRTIINLEHDDVITKVISHRQRQTDRQNIRRNLEPRLLNTVADIRGAPRERAPPPPTAQNVLNSMHFFGKFGNIIYWCTPPGLAPPPTGNSGSAPAISTLISVFIGRSVH